jgi:hypothetical protein
MAVKEDLLARFRLHRLSRVTTAADWLGFRRAH